VRLEQQEKRDVSQEHIDNTGNTKLRFLEIFKGDYYADVSLDLWLALAARASRRASEKWMRSSSGPRRSRRSCRHEATRSASLAISARLAKSHQAVRCGPPIK
jgi:hypothetical protein